MEQKGAATDLSGPEKLRPLSTTFKSSLQHAGFPRVPDRGILYQSVTQRFQGSWSWDSLTLVSGSEINP
jgi:hypothetical protein